MVVAVNQRRGLAVVRVEEVDREKQAPPVRPVLKLDAVARATAEKFHPLFLRFHV